jgi:hypothetical protein
MSDSFCSIRVARDLKGKREGSAKQKNLVRSLMGTSEEISEKVSKNSLTI